MTANIPVLAIRKFRPYLPIKNTLFPGKIKLFSYIHLISLSAAIWGGYALLPPGGSDWPGSRNHTPPRTTINNNSDKQIFQGCRAGRREPLKGRDRSGKNAPHCSTSPHSSTCGVRVAFSAFSLFLRRKRAGSPRRGA